MKYEVIDKFRKNNKYLNYLRENSNYYKELNRDSDYYDVFTYQIDLLWLEKCFSTMKFSMS